METVICDYCHHSQTDPLPNETRALNLQPPYMVVRCRSCGLMYMNPRMTAVEYREYYSSAYYQEEFDYDTIVSGERVPKFTRRLQIMKRLKPTLGRLLDVGTATGEFLDAAKRDGWNVSGTEVSEYAAREARQKFGLDIFIGELVKAPFAPASFDAIHISHVLEHVPSPRATLRLMRRLLKNDGLLIVEVPYELHNGYVQLARLFRRNHPPKQPSMHHTYFYTTASLRRLMSVEGFQSRVRTYSMDIPYRHMPAIVKPVMAPLARLIDAVGSGLYIEAYARKVPVTT